MRYTTARRIPAPYGHSRATNEPQHTVLEECDDHHEAAEGDGAHVLPVNERVLKKLSVAAHVKAESEPWVLGKVVKVFEQVPWGIKIDKFVLGHIVSLLGYWFLPVVGSRR